MFPKPIVFGLLGLALVMGAPERGACLPQQTTGAAAANTEDSSLQSRVLAGIKKDASLAARQVDVTVEKGIVTLKGTVRTAKEKSLAARLATVEGVATVRNELVVDAQAAKGNVAKAVDATKTAAEKTGSATKDSAQKVG